MYIVSSSVSALGKTLPCQELATFMEIQRQEEGAFFGMYKKLEMITVPSSNGKETKKQNTR